MADKPIRILNVGDALARRAYGQIVPAGDSIQLAVELSWTKGLQLGIANMTARDARKLAVRLLQAAETLDSRAEQLASRG